jgi:hypothetical protein
MRWSTLRFALLLFYRSLVHNHFNVTVPSSTADLIGTNSSTLINFVDGVNLRFTLSTHVLIPMSIIAYLPAREKSHKNTGKIFA